MSWDSILDKYRKVYKKGDLIIFNSKCTKPGVVGSIWEISRDSLSLDKHNQIMIKPCSLTIGSLENRESIDSIQKEPDKRRLATCYCLDYYHISNEKFLSYLSEE